MTTHQREILSWARQVGVFTPKDLEARGWSRSVLPTLVQQGLVHRIGRGLYEHSEVEVTEHHTLVEIAKRVPEGIVCLLSALRFHDLGTQHPHQVWLAIDHKARAPKAPGLPIRLVRFSGPALSEGIERHQLEGVSVAVTSPARTVVDCFRFRNKLGLDVALEALRAYLHRQDADLDELSRLAAIGRVASVMRPYVEAML